MTEPRHDPSQSSSFRITKFDCWEPGRYVHVRIPSGGPLAYLLNMSIFGAVFGLPAAYVLFRVFGELDIELSFWKAAVVTVVPFATLGGIQIAAVDTPLNLIIDWSAGTLKTSSNVKRRAYRLQDLQSLIVRGLYHVTMRSSSSSTRSERVYRAQLDARFEGADVSLFKTDSQAESAELAVAQMTPFAQDLADSLNVELRQLEPVKQSHGKLLKAITSVPLWLSALFLVQLIAAGGYLSWTAQPAIDAYRMRREIERHHGSVSQSSWTIAEEFQGSVSSITFDREVKDSDLIALRETLLKWEPFKLDLKETSITDKGLQSIEGMDNLLSINLRDTRVSDSGVHTVSSCSSLVEVNLNSTRVTDEAVGHLVQLPKLKGLHLWNTRITDASISELVKLDGALEIYLNDTRVTPDGLKRLKESIPATVVHP